MVVGVEADTAPASLTNTAGVYSTDDPTPGIATTGTTVVATAALDVSKVALTEPANAGGVALYQIVVDERGAERRAERGRDGHAARRHELCRQ